MRTMKFLQNVQAQKGWEAGEKLIWQISNAKFENFIFIQSWGQNRALKRSLCTHAATKNSHLNAFQYNRMATEFCALIRILLFPVYSQWVAEIRFLATLYHYTVSEAGYFVLWMPDRTPRTCPTYSYLLGSPVSFTLQLWRNRWQDSRFINLI